MAHFSITERTEPGVLYPMKISFRNEGRKKMKGKLKHSQNKENLRIHHSRHNCLVAKGMAKRSFLHNEMTEGGNLGTSERTNQGKSKNYV